jgi:hypothetical protein
MAGEIKIASRSTAFGRAISSGSLIRITEDNSLFKLLENANGASTIDTIKRDCLEVNSSLSELYKNQIAENTGKRGAENTNVGIILPMYIYPSNIYTNDDYNNVINLKKKYHDVPLYTILNPSNGAGSVVDGNYTAGIQRLNGAGALTCGYVSTNYTAVSLADAKAEVDNWLNLYPDIQAIFLDEMDNTDSQATRDYYKDLKEYVRLKDLKFTIANAGALVPYSFYTNEVADMIVMYENTGYPTEATLKGDFDGGHADTNYGLRASLSYNVAFDKDELLMIKKYVGAVYLTDDNVPNPWDSLPSYLEDLFKGLQAVQETEVDDVTIKNVEDPNSAEAGLTTTQASSVWGSEFVITVLGTGSYADDAVGSIINSGAGALTTNVDFSIASVARPTKKVYFTSDRNDLLLIPVLQGTPAVNGVLESDTVTTAIGTEYIYSLSMSGGGNITQFIVADTGENDYYVRFWDNNPAVTTGLVAQYDKASDVVLVPTGTTETVDFSTGVMQFIDLGSATGDVTLTLSNPRQGGRYFIKFIQGGTARDVVLPSSVLIEGGTAPTTLDISITDNAIDTLVLDYDGTNYFGRFFQNFG